MAFLSYVFAVIEFFSSSLEFFPFWNRKYKYYCLYFSFITSYPSFIKKFLTTLIALYFAVSNMNFKKKLCFMGKFHQYHT